MKKTLLFLILLLMVACRTQPIIATDTSVTREITEKEYIEHKKIAEPDSALIRALAQCDENNQLLITTIDSIRGSRIDINVTLKQNEKGETIIDFACKEDSLIAEIKNRERIIHELRNNEISVEKIVEKPLTQWQSFCIVLGKITICLIVILIVFEICKIFMRK